MYFKDFPQFLYDFNHGNGVIKTTVVKDITRNIRFKKELLANISVFDEYDIIDGETPEIISEKFYGTPEYHWVVMLANDKYDWSTDFPLRENVLQKHIADTYNPVLHSTDWYWKTHDDGIVYIHLKITEGSEVPFDAAYLTAPTKITLTDPTKTFVKIINFPYDEILLDEETQYFIFPYAEEWDITQFGTGDSANGVGTVKITVTTTGREHNPVLFSTANGIVVDPKINPFAIPVTGDEIFRAKNNQKRRIRIVSPKLLELVLKNYEDLL